MKAIIKNGVANKDIQSCLISECGVEITFHNNDLADKFALSLNLSGIPCVNNRNKITISYIDQLSVSSASYIAEHKRRVLCIRLLERQLATLNLCSQTLCVSIMYTMYHSAHMTSTSIIRSSWREYNHQEYKQALTFGKTNKSAKIPYTLIVHLRVLAKCGSRFCFMYHGL